jgi:tetratricopeptide (TPR) repeat protein
MTQQAYEQPPDCSGQPFWVYHQLGQELVQQHQFTQARSLYQQAIQQYPDNPEAYRALGTVQEKLGDRTGEIESYQQAIALDPEQPLWVYTTLAHLLCTAGRYADAIAIDRTVLNRTPDLADFELYERLGGALTHVGEWSKAIAAYEQALILQPDRIWINHRIGVLRFNRAMQYLEQPQLAQPQLAQPQLAQPQINLAQKEFERIDQVQAWDGMSVPWFGVGETRWPYVAPPWSEALAAWKPADCPWPKIAIVTPSFNQGEFLKETILSVLHQNYPNLEYLIIDGGSTDRTPEILQQYREYVTEIIVEPDRGQSDAINKGFARSTGELLLWLNSDDMLAPGALYAAASTYLQQDCDLVAGICLVHEDGQIIAMRQPRVRQSDFTVEALSDVARLWATGHFFFQPEVLFSRRLWEAAGGRLDESLDYAMDHDLWLRFAQQGAKLAAISWPIALFRQHAAQKTANRTASVKELLALTARYYPRTVSDARRHQIRQKVTRWMRSPRRRVILLGDWLDRCSDALRQELPAYFDRAGYRVVLCDRLEAIETVSYDTVILWVNPYIVPSDLEKLKKVHSCGLWVSWFWCNHQRYPLNAKIAQRVDVCIAAQAFIEEILQNSHSLLANSVPVAVVRWTKNQAQRLFQAYGYGDRSTQLYGRFSFSQWTQRQKQFVDEIRQCLPSHQLGILGEVEQDNRQTLEESTLEQSFARMSSYAVSLCLPEENELTPSIFEALLCGQIPIVSAEVLDLDRVIPPDVQVRLPIIRFSPNDPEAVLEAYREALLQFEAAGVAGIEQRHQFAANYHLLVNRLGTIIEQLNLLSFLSSEVEGIHAMSNNAINESRLVQDYLDRGKEQLERGNYTEAIALYQEAIEQYPECVELYRKLGVAQEKVGDINGEIASYQQAIALEPEQPHWVYATLGKLLVDRQQWQAAIAVFQQAIDLYPESADLYRELGVAQEKVGDIDGEIASYQKAIALQAEQPNWLYLTLSHLLAQNGNSGAAIAVCKALLTVKPDAMEAHRKVLDILLGEQKFDEVFAYTEKAFGDNPSSLEALNALGYAFFKLNQFTRAEGYFQSAIEQYPENYKAYEGLAFIHEALQQYDKAQPYWQHCFEKFPEHPLRSSKNVFIEAPPIPKSVSNVTTSEIEVCPDLDDESFIKLCFSKLLHRQPPPEVLEKIVSSMKLHKISRVDRVLGLLNSEECKIKRDLGVNLVPEYNNEEFVEFLTAILFRMKASKQFKENLLGTLAQGQLRSTLTLRLLADGRLKEEAQKINQASRASQYYIVGSQVPLSVDDWYRKFADNTRNQLTRNQRNGSSHTNKQTISLQSELSQPYWPVVSIITSIYDGDEFIEHFMRHICEQSIFLHDCELIIIDANSPGNECECIQKYCDRYKNIVYLRSDDLITIYDAWNIGVQKARGLFLTNANLDDIRRFDCLELQAKELILNPDIDIVYSDYAYTLEPNIPFEFACLEGHQTSLPVATTENLLMFNSPHCAPMWRKTIHDTLGGFDASFRSAGDMDLWLQASLAGHKFGKIEQTLIAYYHNPKGLSTDSGGVGQDEGLRVIQKYEKLYHDRIASDPQPVSMTVAVQLKTGQNLEISLPDNRVPVPQRNIGKSSYFAFSIYKAGSTLLTDILQLALNNDRNPRPKVNISEQLFKAGIDGRDWMPDENLDRVVIPGYYYIGFREYAPFLEKNPIFKRSRKVLLVRDPRDVIVSYYYSVLKSHTITEGEFGKSQQDFREQVSQIDIDTFVKQQCGWIHGIYQAYIDALGNAKNVRTYKYEEVIFNKVAWINNLLNYLEIEIEPERRRLISKQVDIIPQSEDSKRHIRTVVPGDHVKKLQAETIDCLNQELESILKYYDYII